MLNNWGFFSGGGEVGVFFFSFLVCFFLNWFSLHATWIIITVALIACKF